MQKGKFATSLLDRQVIITYGTPEADWEKVREYYSKTSSVSHLRYVGLTGHIRTVLPDDGPVYFQVELESTHELVLVKSDSVRLGDEHESTDPYSYAMMKIMKGINTFEANADAASEREAYVIKEIKLVIEEEDAASLHIKTE